MAAIIGFPRLGSPPRRRFARVFLALLSLLDDFLEWEAAFGANIEGFTEVGTFGAFGAKADAPDIS
jgi:hypothetical protein